MSVFSCFYIIHIIFIKTQFTYENQEEILYKLMVFKSSIAKGLVFTNNNIINQANNIAFENLQTIHDQVLRFINECNKFPSNPTLQMGIFHSFQEALTLLTSSLCAFKHQYLPLLVEPNCADSSPENIYNKGYLFVSSSALSDLRKKSKDFFGRPREYIASNQKVQDVLYFLFILLNKLAQIYLDCLTRLIQWHFVLIVILYVIEFLCIALIGGLGSWLVLVAFRRIKNLQ